MSEDGLNPVIHAAARLRLMVTLATLPEGDNLSFTRLQELIGLTPGNLITHLRKLEDAGYVQTNKTGSGVNALTTVALTHDGRAALERYTAVLRQLLDTAELAQPQEDESASAPRGSGGRRSRAEGAGLDEFEIDPALALGKEWNAAANQHRVDPGPVLVDQTQRGRLGGGVEPPIASGPPPAGSQPLDLLRQAAGGQAGIAPAPPTAWDHHLREQLQIAAHSSIESSSDGSWSAVSVQHRLVKPSSRRWMPTSRISSVTKRRPPRRRRPVEAAVRPDDVAVK